MIRYLSLEEILELHRLVLRQSGGLGGVGDLGGLESACAQPQMTFDGQDLYPCLPTKAAALGFSLIRNHPFVDGNKRTGAASAIVFLAVNDVQIANDEDALVELTLGIAEGNVDKQQVASFFRRHARPLGEGE